MVIVISFTVFGRFLGLSGVLLAVPAAAFVATLAPGPQPR